VEFGSVRPGRLPRRAMDLLYGDTVRCRGEVSAADVEGFGASLSSEQRALVTTFDTNRVRFTAWPELVRVFPNLDRVGSYGCGLVEFPLALCVLPKLHTLSRTTISWRSRPRCRGCSGLGSSFSVGVHGSSDCPRR